MTSRGKSGEGSRTPPQRGRQSWRALATLSLGAMQLLCPGHSDGLQNGTKCFAAPAKPLGAISLREKQLFPVGNAVASYSVCPAL